MYNLDNASEFQAWYDRFIAPLQTIPNASWTEDQQDDWDFYSDVYKDKHGYRPRGWWGI